MNCHGQFVCSVKHGKNNNFPLRIFVVEADTDNLLSRSAACSLGLVTRTERLDDVKTSVFGGLDDKPIQCKPVKIKLKENAEPYSIGTARRVPIPLIEKVKAELERMKENNIIEEITEATDWCAPMVPVLKKNGNIRICTDFKRLNEAVKRERYILPTLDDILHKLNSQNIQQT